MLFYTVQLLLILFRYRMTIARHLEVQRSYGDYVVIGEIYRDEATHATGCFDKKNM